MSFGETQLVQLVYINNTQVFLVWQQYVKFFVKFIVQFAEVITITLVICIKYRIKVSVQQMSKRSKYLMLSGDECCS